MMKHVTRTRSLMDAQIQNHARMQRHPSTNSFISIHSQSSSSSKHETQKQEFEHSVQDLVKELIEENRYLSDKMSCNSALITRLEGENHKLRDENKKLRKQCTRLVGQKEELKSFYKSVNIYPIISQKLQEVAKELQRGNEEQMCLDLQ